MFSNGNLSLQVAPDGLRAWAFARLTPQLAQIDLTNLQPSSLEIERPIMNVFDIIAGSDERALVALHPGGGLGATVMDARSPDTAETRFFPGLLFGGN